MSKDWSVEKLITTAKAFDKKAARLRSNGRSGVSWWGEYSTARRLAFTARKYARTKVALKKDENRCEEHDVNLDNLPSGYSRCPYCEERDRIEAERQHQMTRDPTLEPW